LPVAAASFFLSGKILSRRQKITDLAEKPERPARLPITRQSKTENINTCNFPQTRL
jgi:hypothetical protein